VDSIWGHNLDCVFNNSPISSPHAIVFRLLSFLQHWAIAVRVVDKSTLEQVAKAIRARMPMELVATGS
jgi:hypothetical protein